MVKPKHLQSLAVFYFYFVVILGPFISLGLVIYTLLFTNYGWIILLYFIWMYIDRHTIERGGRKIGWYYNSKLFKHFRDYFPQTSLFEEGVCLDPKKNYLMCCFPHGILPAGANCLSSRNDLFPNHERFFLTLNLNFIFPILREIQLAGGSCASSAKSIEYILNKNGGGNIAVLTVGGAKEAEFSKPGKYCLYYEKRKGFIKLALKSGASLLPSFSFGEVDLFDQPNYSPSVRKMQERFKKNFKVNLLLPIGNFFFFPYKKAITTIVGQPIDLPKIAEPTQEDIDKVHANFKQKLIDIFEKHKHKYVENPESTNLNFV